MLILSGRNFGSDPLLLARSYLAPPVYSFWKWDDAGQVVVWEQATTIAFREELVAILTRLTPIGLPPLSAVLLLLAACRDSWHQSNAGIGTLVGLLTTFEECSFPSWLPDVLSRLDAVGALCPELRRSPEAAVVMAEIVFEGWQNRTSPADAEAIVQVLAAGPTRALLSPQAAQRNDLQDLLDTLQGLDRGLQDVTPERLKLRLRTGLDELVEPAAVDLNAVERTRRLIASLLDDEQLGGVARIARHLMAAVHLPRSISDHDDLPVGGVTDISNRGPLDRLLLSELAHDDLTLAVRVALKEALYLRREAPPHNPPQHRAVLLDAGLRMWGVPRVFATGVALALTATATRHVFVDVYRAQRDDVVRVDLTTREGLVRHLEALEPEAQPGDALAKFLTAASDAGAPREAVLVTGEDVGADPAFRRSLAALQAPTLYLATVARDGSFRLAVRSVRGRKLVCQARLWLDELLAPRASRRGPPLVDKRRAMDLPAIFSVRPFPLLLPHAVDPARMWPIGPAGLLAVTRDRRLMHWRGTDRAARQLTDRLPAAGKVVWFAPVQGATSAAVVGRQGPLGYHYLSVDWQSGEVRSVRLREESQQATGFAASGGALLAFFDCFVKGSARVDVIDTSTGGFLASHDLGRPISRRHGRIVRLDDGWYCLSWDGLRIHLERVLDAAAETRLQLRAVFESPGREGVVGVMSRGHLYSSTDEQMHSLPVWGVKSVQVVAVADDGSSLLLSRPGVEPPHLCVELPDMNVSAAKEFGDSRLGLLWLALGRFVSTRPLPWQYSEIIGNQTDGLSLTDSEGQCWRLVLDSSQDRLWLTRVRDAAAVQGLLQRFKQTTTPAETGYQLRLAQWKDGSRAWLDSRGLLHLRSSDANILEITMVLNSSHVAGWCGDGRVFGGSYFIGEAPSASAGSVFREVLQPFVARLR